MEIAPPGSPQPVGPLAAVSPRPEPQHLAAPKGLKVSGEEWGGNNWVEFIQMKTSFMVIELSLGLPSRLSREGSLSDKDGQGRQDLKRLLGEGSGG